MRKLLVLAAFALTACDTPAPVAQPIFVNGRAAINVGDSLFAAPSQEAAGAVVFNRAGRVVDTIGVGEVDRPGRVQFAGGRWYISDVLDEQPSVVMFGMDGSLERRVDLAGIAMRPHQFAVLGDGALVVEAADRRLVVLRGDSIDTFALVEAGPRPSILTGIGGGVLHAVPDRAITFYNGLGGVRWRLEWPWVETAFVSDVTADGRGRIHVISGVGGEDAFITYSLAPATGEVVRWSSPTPLNTFAVGRLGDVTGTDRWSIR